MDRRAPGSWKAQAEKKTCVEKGTGHCRSNAPHSLRVTYPSVAP